MKAANVCFMNINHILCHWFKQCATRTELHLMSFIYKHFLFKCIYFLQIEG